MSHFTYENQGSNTYLVYHVSRHETLDTMSLGMLTNNHIKGLADTYFTQMNEDRFVKFNVSSKMSAAQLFMGTMNKKRLLGIFRGISDAVLSAEDYMIDINTIVLDLDYIFTDVSTCETILICIPIKEKSQETGAGDVASFLKQIMFRARFDQTENVDYVTRIINFLNGQQMFSLENFKALLVNISQSENNNGNFFQAEPARKEHSVPPVSPIRTEMPAQSIPPVQSAPPVQSVPPLQSIPPVQPTPPVQSIPPVQPVPPVQSIPSASPKKSIPSQQEYAIPQPAPFQKHTSAVAIGTNSGESKQKPMNMFYLLSHYSKENVALYKEQKSNSKAGKTSKEITDPKGKKQEASLQSMKAFEIPIEPQVLDYGANEKQPAVIQVVQSVESVAQQAVSQTRADVGVDKDFGDTVIYGEREEDQPTLFNEKSTLKTPYLIRRKNNEKIPINKKIFRLGRDGSFNDYVIADNMYVGHSHCHIVTREGEYFLVDDNSLNHTYLDNKELPPSVEVKISHGKCIRLSDEEFEFRLF